MDLTPYVEATYDIDQPGWGHFYQTHSPMGYPTGVPAEINVMCIDYNMEMIKNAGLEDPYDLWKRGEWTWDMFLEYTQKLTTGEGTDKVYGFTSEEGIWWTANWVWSNGASFYNGDHTESLLTDDAFVEAVDFMFKLHSEYGIAPLCIAAENYPTSLVPAQRVAMWGDCLYYRASFQNLPFDYGIVPWPVGPQGTQTGNWGSGLAFTIPANSPHPDEAWEVIEFFSNYENTKSMMANGGGIPVVRKNGKLCGTPAVIDKDFGSELLAELLDADVLVILTAVEKVAINFNKPDQKGLDDLTPAQAKIYMDENQFAKGSMLPKVQAAVKFAESKPGRTALITLLEKAKDGIAGKTGTRIHQ